jgi:predicted lipoprotein with Yx(FWY)xxD motif
VKYRNMTGALAALLLLLAACQPSASPTDASVAPSGAASVAASAPASEAAGVTLTIVETSAGTSLAGADGLTLYVQIEEEGGNIVCVDDCLTNWPPLTDTVAAGAADASLLGTIERPDGATQATYNGFPLYYYAGDAAEGDATGEGLGGVWFIANPTGEFGPSS